MHYRSNPLAQILAAGISLFTAVAAFPVHADEQDTLNIQFSEAFAHDDNVFRLPDNVDPATLGLGKSTRSDNIRTDSLSLTADKQYSLQRFHLGARIDHFSYSNYDFLDHTTKNFDGRWNWSLTPHVTGLIAAERIQALANFADTQNYVRSIRTTDNLRADSELGSIDALRFVVGAAQSKTSDTRRIQQEWDYRNRNAHAGIRYLTAAGNSIGYRYRENRIEWLGRPADAVNLYDDTARQGDHEVFGQWALSAQSRLDGALARIKRRHDNFSERDYSGTAGRVDVNWLFDAQIRLNMFVKREFATWWSNTASYTVTDSYGVVPTWQVTEKIALFGHAEYSERKYRGSVIATSADLRLDKLGLYQVGLDWEAMRNLTIGGSIQNSRRTSSASGFSFTDTITSLHAQVRF